MKKILVVLGLAITMATGFVACGKQECGLCGEMGSCKKMDVFGEEVPICKDCREGLEALGSLF